MPVAFASSVVASSWRAMGTQASVRLVGGCEVDLVDARLLIDHLEARWSRFRPDSELSRINAAAGRATPVSPETATLVADAVAWWEATDGRFDPTVLAALLDAGYVRSFVDGPGSIGTGAPVPGCAGVRVDLSTSTASVPAGVSLDLGGIGKGRAVDLVVAALAPVAEGGLVDLGGDLRVWGRPAQGDGWPVGVEDLRTGDQAALLWLASGAVATSTTLRRRWEAGGRSAHHLIDPATGRPSTGDLVSVTVVAADTSSAEVLAKAALVAGGIDGATAVLEHHGAAGLVVPSRGEPVTVGDFVELCWSAREVR